MQGPRRVTRTQSSCTDNDPSNAECDVTHGSTIALADS